jgi:hypothetical protein
VQSSRELYERQIEIEREEIAPRRRRRPPSSRSSTSQGVPEDEARRLADRIVGDAGAAVTTLAREELGIDPEELGGSAWEAAGRASCSSPSAPSCRSRPISSSAESPRWA